MNRILRGTPNESSSAERTSLSFLSEREVRSRARFSRRLQEMNGLSFALYCAVYFWRVLGISAGVGPRAGLAIGMNSLKTRAIRKPKSARLRIPHPIAQHVRFVNLSNDGVPHTAILTRKKLQPWNRRTSKSSIALANCMSQSNDLTKSVSGLRASR
jgi:hypothetical protein